MSEDGVYVRIGRQVIYLDSKIANNSRFITNVTEDNEEIGKTSTNPIPLSPKFTPRQLASIILYLQEDFLSLEITVNVVRTMIDFFDYIAYDEGIISVRDRVIYRLYEGDFQNYGNLYEVVTEYSDIFHMNARDIIAVLLNPIYRFGTVIGVMDELRGTRDIKECLLNNYLYETGYDVSDEYVQVFNHILSSPEIRVQDKEIKKDLQRSQMIIVDIERPGFTNDKYFFTVYEPYYKGKYTISVYDWNGIREGYRPFKSISGNDLNVVDHSIGDVLDIIHDKNYYHITSVTNLSIYDMTDNIRSKDNIPMRMYDKDIHGDVTQLFMKKE